MTKTKQGSRRVPPYIEFCKCGHTGGQEHSQHGPRYAPGHGPCTAQGCKCRQFTWAKRTMIKE